VVEKRQYVLVIDLTRGVMIIIIIKTLDTTYTGFDKLSVSGFTYYCKLNPVIRIRCEIFIMTMTLDPLQLALEVLLKSPRKTFPR
jgi:hypothetical protein